VLSPFLAVALLCARLSAAAEMKTYDTPYYVIHTDLDESSEKEAAVRLTRMAETYHDRTKDFARTIDHKFPFYLFSSRQDYLDAGGAPASAGVFLSEDGGKLLAFAGDHPTLATWHTVQHEGFHQFAHAVIGGQLPPWLNEGLAEYFGEGIFTGDGFLTGYVPPWRLARLKRERNTLLPFDKMMSLTSQQWNDRLNLADYDQAWSMVQFLVHGDGERYQQPLAACIREISSGKKFEQAWLDTIGPADGFEKRWRDYWLAQPPDPTADLYDRAMVSILTSFLARATAAGQTFASFDAFIAAARQQQLKINADDWLPPALLSDGIDAATPLGRWELIVAKNRSPMLRLNTDDHGRFTGSFTVVGTHVERVSVTQDRP
jgi:hypothetical protein